MVRVHNIHSLGPMGSPDGLSVLILIRIGLPNGSIIIILIEEWALPYRWFKCSNSPESKL